MTRELEPYARYLYDRLHFECYYQPDPQPVGKITIGSLENSISGDEERYRWISGEPLILDFIHMFWCKPARLTEFAKINAEYMAGFRDKHYIVRGRIYMMTACLIVGETYEDDAVSKKLLRHNAMGLWARTSLHHEWFRAQQCDDERFSPTAAELKTALKKLIPSQTDKFHWPEVYTGLGLTDLAQFGKQTHKGGRGTFSWMMRSGTENHEDVADLLDALDCIDDEHTK